jgi:hypothetical protein
MNTLLNKLTSRNGWTMVQWLWTVGALVAFLWADKALSTRWPDSYGMPHPLAALATLYMAVAVVMFVFRPLAKETK